MYTVKFTWIATLALLLASCVSYKYNSESFSSASAALNAQDKYLANVANGIEVRSTSIPGRAIVITPTSKTCAALGVVRTNTPQQEFIDYVAASQASDFAVFAKYLEKSAIFSSIEGRIVDSPLLIARQVKNEYAATIYLHMFSPQRVGWYMLTPGVNEPQSIKFDSTSATGAPRVNSWVSSIATQLKP